VTVPDRGFGPGGEEYIIVSAFGHRECILIWKLPRGWKIFISESSFEFNQKGL
jgi:hypothetical protein